MVINGCNTIFHLLMYLQGATCQLSWLLGIDMGCSCRRILIFPKGNNVDHLSMYLDVADSNTLPYGWSRYAQFSLAVVNQIHNKYSMRKGIC